MWCLLKKTNKNNVVLPVFPREYFISDGKIVAIVDLHSILQAS